MKVGNVSKLFLWLGAVAALLMLAAPASAFQGKHDGVQNLDPFANCTGCHGSTLMGAAGPSCYTCHGPLWAPEFGGPYSGEPGVPVQFDASETLGPDGGSLTVMWVFPGGGQPVFGVQASHTFDAEGSFVAKLTYADSSTTFGPYDIPVTIEAAATGPTYVGDQECAKCHSQKYDDYMQSGHPYKLNKTNGVEPPPDTWPHSPVPPLPPDGLEWNNVSYVIGNFFWKARFIEADGFIHTGDQVQWNLATQEWVSYHSGETKPYDCGRCHTTGYSPEGHQDGLPGLVGTWAQPGIRCEACHGPGSEHIDNPMGVHPEGGKDCSECHYRDADFRMPWKGGFMRHHQQGEEMSHSPHADALDCVTCHNPHKSVVYDLGGTIMACEDCHASKSKNDYKVLGMESLACIDCHMPDIGKSAVAENAHKGDVKGHLFRIMTDPVAAADNTYEVNGTTFWNQDENGQSAITLDYACLGCHINFDPDFTLEEAAEYAKGIHDRVPPTVGDTWLVKLPLTSTEFTVTFEQFAGIVIVHTTAVGGEETIGIGMEMDGVIFWMDISGNIYFGNINRTDGTMSGILFGQTLTSSIFFAEQQ